MKLITAIFLISSVFADPGALLGKEECTYGPSYWCSDALNAKKCGAVQHCVDTVWTKQIIAPTPTMECSLCKTAIQEVTNMLKQNGTEEKIKEYMKGICDLLTDTSLKEKCTKFATTELPLLLDLIKSGVMTPEQICSTIKLCTPGYVDTVQHKQIQKNIQTPVIKSGDVCKDCENFFTDIHNMIVSNETMQQLEDMLKQAVCTQLGPVQDMCNTVVEQYLPLMLEYLGQMVDPATTCRIIGFCDTRRDLQTALKLRLEHKAFFMKFNKKSLGGQEECDFCKNVMTDLQNLDRDPTIQGKIKDFIKTELCKRLGALESECDKFVDENAPVIFELLANELDPETACSFVGFCRSPSLPKSPAKTPVVSVVHLSKTESFKALPLVPSQPVRKPVKTSGVWCPICKLAMNELDSMLSKNATKAEIEQALDQVCDRLPGQLKDQCTDFVNQYAPAVLELLLQEMDPTVVCDKLGLCTPLTKNLKASVECVVCEFVMSEIESLLANNKSAVAVKAAFDKVCSLMPDTIKDECTQFVNQYAPLIINLLINEVKPAQVCKALGLCKSTAARPMPVKGLPISSLPLSAAGILLRGEPVVNAKPALKKTDEECLVCETIINYIDEALKENKTVELIKQLLNRACEVLPKSMADECEGIVIAFGDEIIKEIMQQLDPKQICTDIGVCQAKKNVVLNGKEQIKTILEDRKKQEDNKLYFKPRNEKLRRNPSHLLGEKKCTYGPAYWCKNMDTATECGMVEHCKKMWARK